MFEIIIKGGIVSWVLIAISIVALSIIIAKSLYLLLLRLNNTGFVGDALEALSTKDEILALSILRSHKHPIAKTMAQAINLHKKPTTDFKNNVQTFGNIELIRMRTYMQMLDTITHIAPMLGLLGTVVGMIKAFRELSLAGSQVDITILSTGIWEALITTALGLIISVISLMASNIFESKIEKTRETMSLAVGKLLEILGR